MDICSISGGIVVNSAGQYGLPRASCQRIVQDDAPNNDERGEEFGDMPLACALGVMALPAPASSDGTSAEGVIEGDVGGFPGVVVGAWDARCTDVAGQLSPGDTCLHGTHPDATNRAKYFCKDGAASIVVGNDLILQLDRKNKSVTISAFGALFQITDTQTLITDPQGKAFISLKDGAIQISGNVVLGNATGGAVLPVLGGASGPAGIASLSVSVTAP